MTASSTALVLSNNGDDGDASLGVGLLGGMDENPWLHDGYEMKNRYIEVVSAA